MRDERPRIGRLLPPHVGEHRRANDGRRALRPRLRAWVGGDRDHEPYESSHRRIPSAPEVLAEAWDDIRRSWRAQPDVIVRIGIEVDCFEDRKEDIAGELPGYAKAIGRPLDFIKGSAHEMDGVRFASKKQAHELLDDSDSARSVYVGDRPSWAVVGAARAGFEMPALIDGTRGEVTEPKDEYPAPDDAIRSLFDLLDTL